MKFQVECSQKYTKESFVLQGHFGGGVVAHAPSSFLLAFLDIPFLS